MFFIYAERSISMHKCELLANYLLYNNNKKKKFKIESLVRISLADIFTLIL